MKWEYITLIVIGSLILILAFYVIIQLIFEQVKKQYFQKKCNDSYSFLNTYPGLYTTIVGEIGAGKTTFASGYTNYRTIFKTKQAQAKIDEIIIKYPEVDFNEIDSIIEYLYFNGNGEQEHITNANYIANHIYSLSFPGNDKFTYEDIFAGKLAFKRTTDTKINLSTRFYNDDKLFYKDSDDNVIDDKGFIYDESFNKVVVKEKSLSYQEDSDGMIRFDKYFNPVIQEELQDEEAEQSRDLQYYDNGLTYLDGYTILRDYINAKLALIRNNYVYFINRKFFSFITHNYARDFDEKLTDIKDAYISKSYSIDMYSILFWDEVALSDHKSTNFQAYASSDGGSDAFLRLVRQIGKGTIDVVKTVQDINRAVKVERELLTSVINIEQRDEIIISSFRYKLLNLYKKFLLLIQEHWLSVIDKIMNLQYKYHYSRRLKRKLKLKQGDSEEAESDEIEKLTSNVYLKVNKIRNKVSKIQTKIDKLYASSILAYKGTLYYSADDVNKKDLAKNRFKKFTVFFPIRYCYGSVDTYAYSIVGDLLQLRSLDHSNYTSDTSDFPEESRENRRVFVEKILTKDSIKKELNKKINEDKTKEVFNSIV